MIHTRHYGASTYDFSRGGPLRRICSTALNASRKSASHHHRVDRIEKLGESVIFATRITLKDVIPARIVLKPVQTAVFPGDKTIQTVNNVPGSYIKHLSDRREHSVATRSALIGAHQLLGHPVSVRWREIDELVRLRVHRIAKVDQDFAQVDDLVSQ